MGTSLEHKATLWYPPRTLVTFCLGIRWALWASLFLWKEIQAHTRLTLLKGGPLRGRNGNLVLHTCCRGVLLTVSAPSTHPKTTAAGHISASQHRPKDFLRCCVTKILPQPVSANPRAVSESVGHSFQKPRVQFLSATPILHTHIYQSTKGKLEKVAVFHSHREPGGLLSCLIHTEKLHPYSFPAFVKC